MPKRELVAVIGKQEREHYAGVEIAAQHETLANASQFLRSRLHIAVDLCANTSNDGDR